MTCGVNQQIEVERFGTELVITVSEHLADAQHHDLDDLEYR